MGKNSNMETIAICNQKGGVGKTVTAVNLGIGLAMQGKHVFPTSYTSKQMEQVIINLLKNRHRKNVDE